MSIGDITSTAKGSGARFNDGKAAVELIPLSFIAATYRGAVGERLDPVVWALDAAGRFQVTGDVQHLLKAMGYLSSHWLDCARVFEYGRKKYSKRGDCTCSVKSAELKTHLSFTSTSTKGRMNQNSSLDSAADVTTSSSKLGILDIKRGNERTIEGGTKTQKTISDTSKKRKRGRADGPATQNIKKLANTPESKRITDFQDPNTTVLCPGVAKYEGQPSECMSTTAMKPGLLEEFSAIPATLALDLSKGLEAGLKKHSPTCGVHRIQADTGLWNWAKGMAWSVPLGCIGRHSLQILADSELIDSESGEHHAGHILCNLVMLTAYTKTYPEGNDLPIRWLREIAG